MNIGLFGGSFDPIHNGHLSIIRGALKSGAVDCVIVIPTVRNSFKRGRILSVAPYRYYMVKNVIEDTFKDDVFISDVEFFYEGISYTTKTIAKIKEEEYLVPFLIDNGVKKKKANEGHKFYWLCGTDLLPNFDKWYDPQGIVRQAQLMVAVRPGMELDIDKEAERLSKAMGVQVDIKSFDIKGIEAASSKIRSSKDYDDIPDSTLEFIKTHALYESNDVFEKVSDSAMEKFYELSIGIYPYLRQKRLLHTINVAILAARYAMIHGADVDKALIAGLMHDCAKELPEEEQKKMAFELSGDLFDDPNLYHSPAGAVFASKKFGIEDQEILDAITYHTTGRGNMSLLEKCVFLADKLEPARTYGDLRVRREVALVDIDASIILGHASLLKKFEAKNRKLHPLTAEFVEDLGNKS